MSLLIAMRPVRSVALAARNAWDSDLEDQLSAISDADPDVELQHHRQALALRYGARQIAEQRSERRTAARPPGPQNPDITFQEAVRRLTDFDPASLEARPGALAARRRDGAPRSGTARAHASRTG